jgi:DNA-binding NarL/FixJ family response regulator
MTNQPLKTVHRIGVLEDDDDLRAYLAGIIQETEGLRLAFAEGTLAGANRRLDEGEVDLCLVDIKLPDGNGLDFVARVKAQSAARCLILTVLGDRASVIIALQAGADGYLLKDTPPEQLRRSILLTLAGESPLSPRAATYLLEMWKAGSPATLAAGGEEALTSREAEVLRLFSRGLSYRETADALGISQHTVGDYVKVIYRKLSVHSRSEAVFEARQLGLISPLG